MPSPLRRPSIGQPNAYASISLYGNADPALWTAYFGIQPDVLVIKGALFRTPSGRMSTHPGRIGVWGCSSKVGVNSDLLDPHVRHLIARLGLPRTDLPERLAKYETSMRLFCFWYNQSGNRSPILDHKLGEIVKNSGARIEINEYPDPARRPGSLENC